MTDELARGRDREAATREILEVISQSRDDDKPVFDVVLRKAAELCHASMAGLNIISEDRSHAVLVAVWGDQATDQLPAGTTVWPMDAENAPSLCVREGQTVHLHDMADTDLYRSGDAKRVAAVDSFGIRTFLAVPLFSGDQTVGCISVYRNVVKPFATDEITLLETFAAQAVIAIENVRQFRELQSRLAREAATSEILSIISQSRDDDQPVFEVIVKNAQVLCEAPMCGLILANPGEHALRLAAHRNVSDKTVEVFQSGAMTVDGTLSYAARSILERSVINLPDMAESELYKAGSPIVRYMVEEVGMRSLLFVPLIAGDVAIGTLALFRYQVFPFEERHVELVRTFAAQAVIAIENVRQFRELQDRLEREAATRNILRVISESPDNEQPTFEAILESATRLCGTEYASIVLGRKGDASQRMVAHRADIAETLALFREGKVPMDPEDSIAARAILEGRTIHVPDMADTDQYHAGHERFRLVVDRLGLRTNLFVPLLGPEGGIGCFILWKKEVAPFTADQITLMETFASHAVIAIENVRQFKALEALNAELGDRVEAQVGEIERMGRLKRFLPAAVADAVVSSGSERMLSSHRALLGVLFCDIRGFTAFCETAEPEETIEVLQTYHEEMGKLINAHGAGVDHRTGDGIMVLFNDPLPCNDPAGEAVRLAMAMRARMAELGQQWKRLGHRLGFGVGVSLGYATVGMVGFEGRFDYTASGTAINLASRLCDEALDGEILLSPRASIAVEDRFLVESKGEMTLKGIREPVEVFRLSGSVEG